MMRWVYYDEKSAIFTIAFIMGLSLSACGNKTEEVSNMKTVETTFNAETETASSIETETISFETERLESQEISIIEDESVATSSAFVISSDVATNSPVSITKVSSKAQKEVTNSTSNSSNNVSAADMETLYHENLHKWTTGTTWKASNSANLLQFGYSNGTGIGLTHMAWDYTWTLQYNGSEWVLTIINNLSELQWDGIHNSLRLISPDGDAVCNAIYEQYYYGTDGIVDCWYTIPNASSEIYVPSSNAQVLDYGRYYFR